MKFLRLAFLFFLLITVKFLTGEGNANNKQIHDKAALDCPQVNDSNAIFTPSDCNSSNGSIVGITGSGGTGSYHYFWFDSENAKVSSTADLLNVPPGDYVLQFNDGSKCATQKKTYTVGQKNVPIINDSTVAIKPSDCGPHNGSITHLTFQNAVSYQWMDNTGAVISTTPSLLNVTSGVYTLRVSNATGCVTSKTYSVPSTVFFPQVAHLDTVFGTCGQSPGSFNVTFNPDPTAPLYHYIYVDPSGNVVDNDRGFPITGIIFYSPDGPTKINLPIGTPNAPHSLILSDQNNCSMVVGTYSLPPIELSILVTDVSHVRNDACGRHTGGVLNLGLTGETIPKKFFGTPPNQAWTWTDSLGNVLTHLPDLTSVGKGTYTVLVQDIGGCTATRTFTIQDSVGEASPPKLNNITMCLPGAATLSVIDANPDLKYRLYDSSQTPLKENITGVFQQTVEQTTTFYVATINGLCESDFTPVTVTVVAPGVIIPNAFTPNNDGINDYWNIPHLDEFPGADISVFNRDGQLVYHSINYAHPFDGKLNGKELSTGVYYYVIDLKQPECLGKVSGTVTVLR